MMDVGSPRFDISAKLPLGVSKDRVPEMVQTLLADRFRLTVHRGTITESVYGLIVAKSGATLERAVASATGSVLEDTEPPVGTADFYGELQSNTTRNADGTGFTTTIRNPRMGTVRETGDPRRLLRWEAPSTSLGGLADLLDKVAPLPAPIIDMTRLGGRYHVIVSGNDRVVYRSRPSGYGEFDIKGFQQGPSKVRT